MSAIAFWHGGLTPTDAETCLAPVRQAGFDIAAFNTTESARDLIRLRQALHVTTWNLLGTSYGTVLAMELVRQDGGAVRSAVLNSPSTPQASWLDTARMAEIRAVYQRLFAACAADAACARAYPHLEQVFLDLAQRLTTAPPPVTVTDPTTGQAVHTTLNLAALLDILTILVGSGTSADRVPGIVWSLHEMMSGHTPLRPEYLAWIYMPFGGTMDAIAYGLNAAIGCRESRAWIDAAELRRQAKPYQPYVVPENMERDYDVICPAWNLPKSDLDVRHPVQSSVPVLLLTGDYDTLAPTYLANVVAQTLPKSQLVRFPGLGHDIIAASPCARTALARFIAQPEERLTLDCLATQRTPRFVQ